MSLPDECYEKGSRDGTLAERKRVLGIIDEEIDHYRNDTGDNEHYRYTYVMARLEALRAKIQGQS